MSRNVHGDFKLLMSDLSISAILHCMSKVDDFVKIQARVIANGLPSSSCMYCCYCRISLSYEEIELALVAG